MFMKKMRLSITQSFRAGEQRMQGIWNGVNAVVVLVCRLCLCLKAQVIDGYVYGKLESSDYIKELCVFSAECKDY